MSGHSLAWSARRQIVVSSNGRRFAAFRSLTPGAFLAALWLVYSAAGCSSSHFRRDAASWAEFRPNGADRLRLDSIVRDRWQRGDRCWASSATLGGHLLASAPPLTVEMHLLAWYASTSGGIVNVHSLWWTKASTDVTADGSVWHILHLRRRPPSEHWSVFAVDFLGRPEWEGVYCSTYNPPIELVYAMSQVWDYRLPRGNRIDTAFYQPGGGSVYRGDTVQIEEIVDESWEVAFGRLPTVIRTP
jgi:hypothetical protein